MSTIDRAILIVCLPPVSKVASGSRKGKSVDGGERDDENACQVLWAMVAVNDELAFAFKFLQGRVVLSQCRRIHDALPEYGLLFSNHFADVVTDTHLP